MYIKRIEINNIRSIDHLAWSLADDELAGWHVLIGDNGSGKTTILQAVSVALLGKQIILAMPIVWQRWLPENTSQGEIKLKVLMWDEKSNSDYFSDATTVTILPDSEPQMSNNLKSNMFPLELPFVLRPGQQFSVAFGPFRRFSGGGSRFDEVYESYPRLAAHSSIFGEDVAFAQTLDWLQDLRFKQLEGKPDGALLDKIVAFINQPDLLPHGTQLVEVSSDGVFFEDGNGNRITVENMSDGYRSILSLTFELIRQLHAIYRTDDLFSADGTQIKLPGVVLIDEVDAHLHPTWQQRVGFWFRKHFPAMQFIVTTHSPLVCQAAQPGHGSVWRLPTPGTDETVERVTGQALNRLLYGSIAEAHSTHLFGLSDTRSDEGRNKRQRLAELNSKELFTGLSDAERAEQDTLRATLPTAAATTNGAE